MQKILTIGSEEILKGIAISPYYEGGAIFDVASGIDFHRNPGLLGSGYTPTQIGSAVIDHIPKWILPYPASSYIYVLGNNIVDKEGEIYRFLMSDDTHQAGNTPICSICPS